MENLVTRPVIVNENKVVILIKINIFLYLFIFKIDIPKPHPTVEMGQNSKISFKFNWWNFHYFQSYFNKISM